jgi:Leucine-rich repeat (LRR) protein
MKLVIKILLFVFIVVYLSCSDRKNTLDEYLQIGKYVYYKDDVNILEQLISNSCIDSNENMLYEYSECTIDSIYDANKDGVVNPLEIGVTEWGINRRLIVLFAPNRGLSGFFSESILNLTKLKKLDFRNNNIHGNLPESLNALEDIEEIWLDNNSISGHIGESFNKLESLKILSLKNNLFTTISDSICQKIQSLTYYSFFGNNICDYSKLSDCTLTLINDNQDCD